MEYVEMQASDIRPSKSYIERLLSPTEELLTYCVKLEIDRENNVARIDGSPLVIMQISMELWRRFVYCGMSFDKIIISPAGNNSNQVVMHVSSQSDKSKNKVLIKIK